MFEDAKRQAEDAGKLLSIERARLFEKSASLVNEEADLQRRRRKLNAEVEAFKKEKDLAKRVGRQWTAFGVHCHHGRHMAFDFRPQHRRLELPVRKERRRRTSSLRLQTRTSK